MKTEVLKKLLPHFAAYIIMLVISFAFYSPAAFQGKVLNQYDITQAEAGQTEVLEYQDKEGQIPLWTNAMFGGMPSYQVQFQENTNPIRPFWNALKFWQSATKPNIGCFLMMLGMYILLVVLRLDWRISLAGALAFGLHTYGVVWTEAGHASKVISIAYVAPVIAGALLAMRKNYLLGGAIAAFFLALQIRANHIQITYYLIILLGILGIVLVVKAIQEKNFEHLIKWTGTLIIAGLLGVFSNTARLWTTYEYSQESIRGKSELLAKGPSSGGNATEGGLSKDYAFAWSYGVFETYNLFIPNFFGGASSNYLFQDPTTKTAKALQTLGQDANKYARATSAYWGPQTSAAPAYLGALFCLLFFISCILVRGPTKIWVIAGVIFSILLAWGSNFPSFNFFLFDHFPLFNKFRDSKMILSLTNLLVVLLGAMGLQAFLNNKIEAQRKLLALKIGGGIAVGLCLLAFILSGTFTYKTEGLPNNLAAALMSDRKGLLMADTMRTLGIVLVGIALLFAHLKSWLKPSVVVIGILIVALFDHWTVDRRFIETEDFITQKKLKNEAQPSAVDKQILGDKALHYRVADFDHGSPYGSAFASNFHKSIGGYHAAKLMRLQEMVERYLGNPSEAQDIYGMLNVKYFIQNGKAIQNQQALGNAWFVDKLNFVENGDKEIAALGNLDIPNTAVLQSKSAPSLKGWTPTIDQSARIKLTDYHPDKLTYEYSASSDQFAVFSEVYYPPSKGWEVYLDGEKIDPFVKTNFLLRGLKLPAGQKRKLEMVFHPRSYYTGRIMGMIAGLLIILGLGYGIFVKIKANNFPPAVNIDEEKTKAKQPLKPSASKSLNTIKKKGNKKK